MARIFSSLAVVAVTLLVTNLFLGLTGGDYNDSSARLKALVAQWQDARAASRSDSIELQQLTAELDAARAEFAPLRKRATLHILLGVLAALVTVLVHCIAITYFIGTARWCKEVVDAYGFDPQLTSRSAALKRRSFPYSLVGILTVLAIVTLGAAADPATMRETTLRWVTPHLWAAMLGTAVVVCCLTKQAVNIQANNSIVNEVTAAVRAERKRRGLDSADNEMVVETSPRVGSNS